MPGDGDPTSSRDSDAARDDNAKQLEGRLDTFVETMKNVKQSLKTLRGTVDLTEREKKATIELYRKVQSKESELETYRECSDMMLADLNKLDLSKEVQLERIKLVQQQEQPLPEGLFNKALAFVNRYVEHEDFETIDPSIKRALRDSTVNRQRETISRLRRELEKLKDEAALETNLARATKNRYEESSKASSSDISVISNQLEEALRTIDEQKKIIKDKEEKNKEQYGQLANLRDWKGTLTREKEKLAKQCDIHKKRIKVLNEQVDKMWDEIDDQDELREEIENKDRQLEESAQKVLQADIETSLNQIAAHMVEVSAARRVSNLKREKVQAEQKLETKLNDMRLALSHAEDERDQEREALNKANDQYATLTEEMGNLSREKRQVEHSLETLRNDFDQMKVDKEAQANELKKANGDAQNSEDKLTALTREHGARGLDLIQAQSDSNTWKEKYEAHDRTLKGVQRDWHIKEHEISRAKEDIAKKSVEIEKLKEVLKKNTDEDLDLSVDKTLVEDKLKEVQKMRDDLESRLQSAYEDLTKCENQIISINEEKTKLEEEKTGLELETQKFKNWEAEKPSLESRIQALEGEKSALEKERDKLREEFTKYKDWQAEKPAFETTIQALEEEKSALEEERDKLREEFTKYKDWQAEKPAFETTIQALEGKLSTLQDEKDKLQQEFTEFTEWRAEKPDLETRIQSLTGNVSTLQGEKDNLEIELKEHKAKLKESLTKINEAEETTQSLISLRDEQYRLKDDEISQGVNALAKANREKDLLTNERDQLKLDNTSLRKSSEEALEKAKRSGLKIRSLENSTKLADDKYAKLYKEKEEFKGKDVELEGVRREHNVAMTRIARLFESFMPISGLDERNLQRILSDFIAGQWVNFEVRPCEAIWTVDAPLTSHTSDFSHMFSQQPTALLSFALLELLERAHEYGVNDYMFQLIREIIPRLPACEDMLVVHLLLRVIRTFSKWGDAPETVEHGMFAVAMFQLNLQLCARFLDPWRTINRRDRSSCFGQWAKRGNELIGRVFDVLRGEKELGSTLQEELKGHVLRYGRISIVSDVDWQWMIVIDAVDQSIRLIDKTLIRLDREKTTLECWTYLIEAPSASVAIRNVNEEQIQWFRTFVLPWTSTLTSELIVRLRRGESVYLDLLK